MKKIITLVLICFIISGCTTKSDISLNLDGTVREKVTILENNDFFENKYSTKKDVIESAISKYKDILNFKEYDYNITEGQEQSGVIVYKTYDNICEYFGNSYFNQYVYKYIKCIETDEYYEIKNATEFIPYCEGCSDWPRLDDTTLEISLPISAIEHNADKENNNKYTWVFGKYASENKEFYLRIDKNQLLNEYENNKTKIENEKHIKNVIKYVVIGIVIIVIILVGLLLKSKYKKNKIEY